MRKENNRISDGLVKNMRNWRHSGFSVHNEVVINENDREALVRLAQYVVHASFSVEKIRYVEKTNCAMYKSSPAELRSPLQGGIRTLRNE